MGPSGDSASPTSLIPPIAVPSHRPGNTCSLAPPHADWLFRQLVDLCITLLLYRIRPYFIQWFVLYSINKIFIKCHLRAWLTCLGYSEQNRYDSCLPWLGVSLGISWGMNYRWVEHLKKQVKVHDCTFSLLLLKCKLNVSSKKGMLQLQDVHSHRKMHSIFF